MPELETMFLSGTRALQPAASAADQKFYQVEDEDNIIERSDGSTWTQWGPDAPGGGGSGLVQSVYAENSTWSVVSAQIPLDDTLPQSSEGTEILTASITPTSGSSEIRITFLGQFIAISGAGYTTVALFKDSGANALAATFTYQPGSGQGANHGLTFQESAGSTAARTYKIRTGAHSGNIAINGNTGARLLGGAIRQTLLVEELS